MTMASSSAFTPIRMEVIMARARKTEPVRSLSTIAPSMSFKREATRGIQLNVPGRELVVRMTERIRWHRERADALIMQMKKLADVEHEAADDLLGVLGNYESPRKPLEKKVRFNRSEDGGDPAGQALVNWMFAAPPPGRGLQTSASRAASRGNARGYRRPFSSSPITVERTT
jgi:hypothetical protein